MQNEKNNINHARALRSFTNYLEPQHIVETLEEVFFGFIPTDGYSGATPREKDSIGHCYRKIIRFIRTVLDDGPKALKDFLTEIEPAQAKETLNKMLTHYMLTEDFCGALEDTRQLIYWETKEVIDFFNQLIPKK